MSQAALAAAAKSTTEPMGKIVPKRDTGQFHSITSSEVASNTGGTECLVLRRF
jgi:hypothetical protein